MTKLAILGRHRDALDDLSNEALHERFRVFRKRLSDHTAPRHVLLDDLQPFDWDGGLAEEDWPALLDCPHVPTLDMLWLFELVDGDGTPYSEWGSEEGRRWRRRLHDRRDTEALLLGERVQFEGRTVSLRARSRRELVPDHWFDLLELLADSKGHRDVRLVFYWHH